MDIRDPLNLNSPESKPLTTARVVIIAALVALVIGCLPALGTAIIVSQNLNSDSQARTKAACLVVRSGRKQANAKNVPLRLNLKADIKLFELVNRFTPRKVPPGSQITQKQLNDYNAAIKNALVVKKQRVLPLTKDIALPNCDTVSK